MSMIWLWDGLVSLVEQETDFQFTVNIAEKFWRWGLIVNQDKTENIALYIHITGKKKSYITQYK